MSKSTFQEMFNKFTFNDLFGTKPKNKFLEACKKEIKHIKKEIHNFYKLSEFRAEKEIMILCSNNLIKTLKNVRSLNRVRNLEYSKGTDDIFDSLALWIMSKVAHERRVTGYQIYKQIIEIPSRYPNIDRKLELLRDLYELALLYRLDEYEDDESVLSETINLDYNENKAENHNNKMNINFKINEKNHMAEEPEEKLSLAEYVFRYFRYRPENSILLLDSKAFQFLNLIAGKDISAEDKMTLITAYCQSGKSFLVIPATLIFLALGFTPVMVVLDTSQVCQLMMRLQSIIKELCKYLKTLGISDEELSIFDNVLYYDSHNKIKENDKSLENAVVGIERRIIIAIKHNVHISRINKLCNENSNILVVADEAQCSGCYKNKISPTYHDDNIKYEHEFVILKTKAKKCILVSATVMDILMVDENIFSDNIVHITPDEDYTGLKDSKFVNLDVKKDTDIVELSLEIIEELSSQNPITRYDRRHNKTDKHPINVLAKIVREKEDQLNIIEKFATEDVSEKIIDGSWSVIVFNGDGFYLFHKSLSDGNSIKIEDQKSVVLQNNIHFFKSGNTDSINITDVYQYLADGSIEKFPRILTIAYDLASEAISFISNYHKTNNYHLTHGIFNIPPSTSTANAIQAVCRVLGNHADNIKPIVYVSQKTKEKVFKGFELHDMQIQSLVSLSQEGNINVKERVRCPDFLKELAIYDNRVPTVYNKVKKLTLNKIANPNKKEENKILKMDELKCIDYLCAVEPEKYNPIKKKMKEDGMYENDSEDETKYEEETGDDEIESKKQIGETEFNRLTNKMFILWSKNNTTKIANFMENLDPIKLYNEKEMRELCNNFGIKNITQLLSINTGTNGFGTIIQKFKTGYRLYPCLVKSYKKHFNYNM